MLSALREAFSDLFENDRSDAARSTRAKYRPQFERLEVRENPAAQADMLVWGASWQEYHVAQDKHVHVMYSTNGGPVQNLDLSAALGSTTTFDQGGAGVVATTFGGNPYIFARCVDRHVHAFYWTGSAWAESNISTAANYAQDVQRSQIAAHVWNGIPHLFYLGTNQHVHELYWTANTGWKGLDLTAVSGANAIASPTGVITAALGADGTERVFYQGENQHLRELKWSSANGWVDSQISGASAPLHISAAELAAAPNGNSIGLTYVADNQHVIYMANAGGAWTSTDLTTATGVGKLAEASSTLQTYTHNGKINVFYRGTDDHLRGFQWTAGGWSAVDLTFQTGAPLVGDGNGGISVGGNVNAIVNGNTEALFYVDANNKLSRLLNWGDPLFGWQYASGPNY